MSDPPPAAHGEDRRVIRFEVTVEGDTALARFEIPADNWIEAWQLALAELGEEAGPGDVMCAIRPSECVVVVVRHSGRRLTVRSLGTAAGERSDEQPLKKPEELLPAPSAEVASVGQRMAGLPTLGATVQGSMPRVEGLRGDPEEAVEEAVAMLYRHLDVERACFARPGRRGRLVVAAVRPEESQELLGTRLDSEGPIAGLATRQAARLQLHRGIPLTFSKGTFRRLQVDVRSALCAPVFAEGEFRGVFLLLNARDEEGFSEGDLSALAYVAHLVAERWSHHHDDLLLGS